MFSIIIPLYNKAPYIEKAICSVLVQTFQEFEVIVVNDGSTDNGLSIVEDLIHKSKNQNPKSQIIFINQPNTGVSTTRNNGVKLARYEYIAFLDADDWWEPTYLEEMKKLIVEFPDAGIYGCSYYKVKNGQSNPANIGVEPGFKKGYINYFKVYAKSMWMPLWTGATVVKKSIFESENGFKPNLKLGEDFDLWVRVALKHPVAFLNYPLANYNQDVDLVSRAVIEHKLYPPETHCIFNLDYLLKEENRNPDLKNMLDKLRIYSLLRYRIQKTYPSELKKEIDKIIFKNQPLESYLKYKLPIPILKFNYKARNAVSKFYKRITEL